MKANIRDARLWSFFVLLSLVLAACGGGGGSGSTSGSGQTLHVLIGTYSNPVKERQWMQQFGSEFKKATGATIAWDTYSSSNEEQTKLQTAIVSGSGPDVFSFGASFVPTAQATKGFTVLTDQDWQAVGGKSKFFQQQLTMAGSSPSQLISVPWLMRPFVMVYNKELFQKAGITTPPTTWTQFVQDAQKMTDPAAGVYGTEMDAADSFDPWKIWWTFAEQLGGNFLSPDLKTAQLNSPQAVQAANSLASKDPQTAAFLQAEAEAVPTPFTGAWGPLEVSLAGVSSKLANEVATNRYDPSHIKPLLDQANQQIQSQLH